MNGNMNGKNTGIEKKNRGIEKPVALPLMDNYSSRKEWEEASWQKIARSSDLLLLLVTSHERHNLVMRAAVLEGLTSGKGQRQLSKEFSLSTQTINAVRKAMSENNYRSYLERSKKERKKRKYSVDLSPRGTRQKGRPVRTKYGILHVPQ
jgi:Trp operon repressor